MATLYQDIRYFCHRIHPIVVYYLIVQSITRVLKLKDVTGDHLDLSHQLSLLSSGIISDFCVLPLLIIPYIIYVICAPKNYLDSTTDKFINYIILHLYLSIFIITFLWELFFWYKTGRQLDNLLFNDIVRMMEAGNDTALPFPEKLLYFAIGATAALLLWLHHNKIHSNRYQTHSLTTKSKILLGSASIALMVIGHIFNKIRQEYCSFCIQSLAHNVWHQTVESLWSGKTLHYDKVFLSAMVPKKILSENMSHEHAIQNALSQTSKTKSSIIYKKQPQDSLLNIVMIVADIMPADMALNLATSPELSNLSAQSITFQKAYATDTDYIRSLISIIHSKAVAPYGVTMHPQHTSKDSRETIISVLKKSGYAAALFTSSSDVINKLRTTIGKTHVRIIHPNTTTSNDSIQQSLHQQLGHADYIHDKKQKFLHIIAMPPSIRVVSNNQHIKAIGKLIDDYMQQVCNKKWFKNTIFIITSARSSLHFHTAPTKSSNYHIPLLIHAPHIFRPLNIPYQVSQIDIAPTILGLLQLHSVQSFDGTDAISHPPQRAIMQDKMTLSYLENDAMISLVPQKQFCRSIDADPIRVTTPWQPKATCKKEKIDDVKLLEVYERGQYQGDKKTLLCLMKTIVLYGKSLNAEGK